MLERAQGIRFFMFHMSSRSPREKLSDKKFEQTRTSNQVPMNFSIRSNANRIFPSVMEFHNVNR